MFLVRSPNFAEPGPIAATQPSVNTEPHQAVRTTTPIFSARLFQDEDLSDCRSSYCRRSSNSSWVHGSILVISDGPQQTSEHGQNAVPLLDRSQMSEITGKLDLGPARASSRQCTDRRSSRIAVASRCPQIKFRDGYKVHASSRAARKILARGSWEGTSPQYFRGEKLRRGAGLAAYRCSYILLNARRSVTCQIS